MKNMKTKFEITITSDNESLEVLLNETPDHITLGMIEGAKLIISRKMCLLMDNKIQSDINKSLETHEKE